MFRDFLLAFVYFASKSRSGGIMFVKVRPNFGMFVSLKRLSMRP